MMAGMDSTPPRKLGLFGGSRGTGRCLLMQALDAGHAVTVLVRNPARLRIEHPKLRVEEGDAEDYAAVDRVVCGQDAILCTLGAPAAARTSPRAVATRHMVRAMQARGVERLVSLTAYGVGDTRRDLPVYIRYFVVPLFLRHAFADHERQEACIRGCPLQWTIVRPPQLINGEVTGAYRHGVSLRGAPLKYRISREDVAAFMLSQVGADDYLRKAVALSY